MDADAPERAQSAEGAATPSGDAKAAAALQRLGRGIVWTGALLGRAAARAGRSIAGAYQAIDPDVRRHAAQLPLIGLTQLGARQGAPAAMPDDGHRPVIFIHGLQGARGNFLGMQAFFRLAGRRRTYAVSLRPGAPMRELAADLSRFLEDVIACNGLAEGSRVDLVAHSMGGLIARLALKSPATAARVGTLVTLGTPHAGTYAARFAATAQTLELRPGSAVLAALEEQLPWGSVPGQPRLVALWSRSDMLLLPPESGRLEGAENIEVEGFTHFAYLLHPEGWSKALAALQREAPYTAP